jgi:hypothetical protein
MFKPLSFIVFRDAQLSQHILQSVQRHRANERVFDGSSFSGYAKWLCEWGGGLLNLIEVFLRVCDFRGVPQVPAVGVM